MNYAEDRIDRRARNNGLWNDFQSARLNKTQALLANTLRDVGWIRQATFHYGQVWIDNPNSQRAAGDYAQMAELAGFAEVGVVALFHFRTCGRLRSVGEVTAGISELEEISSNWLRKKCRSGNCGCGVVECGQYLCFVPMLDCEITLEAMDSYVSQIALRCEGMPTAHEVLSTLAKPATLSCSDNVSPLLRYWNDRDDAFMPLEPVLQLLLTKLLYLTLPHLAAEAVTHLRFHNPPQLATDFKSHWAYFVLIQSVVLGERIKPHRRRTLEQYHVPVWDLLWGKDQRRNQCHSGQPTEAPLNMMHFKQVLNSCCRSIDEPPKLAVNNCAETPLFVVGDSHVLSIAWQTVVLPSSGLRRLIVPIVVTGIKAWHIRSETLFFTNSLLHTLLQRIDCRTIIISAGEIDCREGIGGQELEGYSQICQAQIANTVCTYVDALDQLSTQYNLQILVTPVAPHAHKSDKYGKAVGRATRRQVMQCWNKELKRMIDPHKRLFLLDYEASLLDPGYVLKPVFNADSTHMNSAFLPHLEAAMQTCGLDENLC